MEKRYKVRAWDGTCPRCGVDETHASQPGKVMIRGLKVFDGDGTAWSQCLVCSGFYAETGGRDNKAYVVTKERHVEDRGWFATRGGGIEVRFR